MPPLEKIYFGLVMFSGVIAALTFANTRIDSNVKRDPDRYAASLRTTSLYAAACFLYIVIFTSSLKQGHEPRAYLESFKLHFIWVSLISLSFFSCLIHIPKFRSKVFLKFSGKYSGYRVLIGKKACNETTSVENLLQSQEKRKPQELPEGFSGAILQDRGESSEPYRVSKASMKALIKNKNPHPVHHEVSAYLGVAYGRTLAARVFIYVPLYTEGKTDRIEISPKDHKVYKILFIDEDLVRTQGKREIERKKEDQDDSKEKPVLTNEISKTQKRSSILKKNLYKYNKMKEMVTNKDKDLKKNDQKK